MSMTLCSRSTAGLAILIAMVGAALPGCNSNAPEQVPVKKQAPEPPATILRPSAARIDLGSLPQGGRGGAQFVVANPGTEAVRVAVVTTDCDCLHVELESPTIPPSGETVARVTFDLKSDPKYRGSLSIPVRGLTETKQLAFTVTVDVEVKAVGEPK